MQNETFTERGIRLAKEGKMDEAREVFRYAIDEIPFDAAVWCNYRATYLHEDKYAEALPEFFRKR